MARGRGPKRFQLTRAEREERWRECRKYLRLAGNLPAARKLANRVGFFQNTSVWITALSQMLGGRKD